MAEAQLTPGIKASLSEKVTPENTAETVGSGTLPVYATPSMTALIEKTAVKCLEPFMKEGQTTVGTMLGIEHVSATPVGITVSCEVELTETDRRKLVFAVTVTDNSGVIGRGKHERFIVDTEKFMTKASGKLN